MIKPRKKAPVVRPPNSGRYDALPAMGDDTMTVEQVLGRDAMTKTWAALAFVSVLLVSGTPAIAATAWADGFKMCDADGNGAVNRAEFTDCEGKLDPTMNPTFTMMDKDGNNRIDDDEWAAAEKQKTAIAKGCKASESSWCPCQNNPDDPECQKSN